MKKKLNWTCYSNEPRLEIIEKIKDAISSGDGYILNFNIFSDLALNLSIEIEENKIIQLHQALHGIVKISEIETNVEIGNSKKEWFIFLNISFAQGSGNLKIKTPDVPG